VIVESKGSVLVIDGDEWVASLLAKYLRDSGYDVQVCTEARDGFARACAMLPDCIVCSVDLPDIDGFWVARRVRTEPSHVAETPIVFLTDNQDKEGRLQGFEVGADVYLQKPYTNEEVVAQVEALIEMANRLSERKISIEPPPSSRSLGIMLRGDIARMSVPTVLMMLELERRTGDLTIEHDFGGAALLYLEGGALIGAKLDDTRKPALEVVQRVLTWKTGRFTFSLSDHEGLRKDAPLPVGQTVLEASRLDDEEKAGV
jgi:two-component system OmpR family response regulator